MRRRLRILVGLLAWGGGLGFACWMIAGQATGLGIRESLDIVTTETACFVPHVILE